MGLDIYLYNGDLNLHFCETPDMPKDEWGSRELGDWTKNPARVHAKSQRYPEHYCERTYLRSSYNDSGYNQVLRNLIDKDWYYVFGPRISEGDASPHEDDDSDDEGTVATERMTVADVKAELTAALVRAREVTAALKGVKDYLRVMTESPTLFTDIANVDAAGALEIVKRELARDRGALGGGYSNREGAFFLDEPVKIIAVVRGVGYLREPVLHLVYRFDPQWYIEASEICEEFIEYALTLDDPRISWSG